MGHEKGLSGEFRQVHEGVPLWVLEDVDVDGYMAVRVVGNAYAFVLVKDQTTVHAQCAMSAWDGAVEELLAPWKCAAWDVEIDVEFGHCREATTTTTSSPTLTTKRSSTTESRSATTSAEPISPTVRNVNAAAEPLTSEDGNQWMVWVLALSLLFLSVGGGCCVFIYFCRKRGKKIDFRAVDNADDEDCVVQMHATTDGPTTTTGQHAVVAMEDSEESLSELETMRGSTADDQGGVEDLDVRTAGHAVLTDEDDEDDGANLLNGRKEQVQRNANEWTVFDA